MSFSRPRRGREEEEDVARAGGEGSTPTKRPRGRGCSCCCCLHRKEKEDFYEGHIKIFNKEIQCLSNRFIEERLERETIQREMQEFYQNSQLPLRELSEQNRRMEQLIREQFNILNLGISSLRDHVLVNSDLRALSQREIIMYRLKFENKCCDDKFSGRVVKADDGNPIKVAIYNHDNRIITNGNLSSIQVKIVVLDGDFNKENKEQWNGDSFLKSIVNGRSGKPPFFANELYLRLENGVANLHGVKFQDNIPGKKFRLGVMAADDSITERILEGISECFNIKAGRGFLSNKDSYPSLSDPICKLKKIAGVRQKKLEKKEINLVRDFLWLYKKDKNSLREACGNISDHDWDISTEHALSCKPEDVIYSYCVPATDETIFFDSLYDIVGVEFNGKYSSYNELDDIKRKDLVEESKKNAYDNLKVVQSEDINSCHEHHVIVGDKGRNYLEGSRSMPQCSTLSTRLHDERHGDDLDSGSAQESPRPRQRWVKLVTVLTTLRFLNTKPQAPPGEMPPIESFFGMPYVSDDPRLEPETSDYFAWMEFLDKTSAGYTYEA